jgi:hypothetical protein
MVTHRMMFWFVIFEFTMNSNSEIPKAQTILIACVKNEIIFNFPPSRSQEGTGTKQLLIFSILQNLK